MQPNTIKKQIIKWKQPRDIRQTYQPQTKGWKCQQKHNHDAKNKPMTEYKQLTTIKLKHGITTTEGKVQARTTI